MPAMYIATAMNILLCFVWALPLAWFEDFRGLGQQSDMHNHILGIVEPLGDMSLSLASLR